jgi:hypothetical protein
MVDALVVRATHPEADLGDDAVHEARHVGAEVVRAQVGEHRLVAAADVVADARRAHVLAVGHDAADRRAVAEVPVGAEHTARALLGLQAAHELVDDRLLVLPEDDRLAAGHVLHGTWWRIAAPEAG